MYEDIFLDVSAALETLGQSEREKPFGGIWEDKFGMNTPGTLYWIGGHYDNAGLLTAPNNIAVFDNFQVIYRQPVNRYELRQVLQAAQACSGCVADGDLNWNYETVKEWWTASHPHIKDEVQQAYEKELALVNRYSLDEIYLSGLARWLDYLKDGMLQYLQVYAFFLDNGRIPTERDTLPEL